MDHDPETVGRPKFAGCLLICIDMSILDTVSPKKTTALRLDTDLLEAMRRVKATDGVPVTTQIEMAVREWLRKRAGNVKTAKPGRGQRDGKA
jgi:hypothetical protein